MIDECGLVSLGLNWEFVAGSCNKPLVSRHLLVNSAQKEIVK